MFRKKLSLIILSIGLCEAGVLKMDFGQKCAINDGDCQKNMLESLLHKYAEAGIPELGIPAMDPYKIENRTLSVLGIMDLTMVDGQVEGATKCSFTKFETDIEKRYTTSESICESVKISGHYKIVPGLLMTSLMGNPVSGDGNGSIQIDKMTLKMKVPFHVDKHEDGEIYIRVNPKETEYSTNDIEMITFGADSIFLGGQNVSENLMKYMNRHWKLINMSFGKLFSDKVMDVFYEHLDKFLYDMPAKNFLSDDLSKYVKS